MGKEFLVKVNAPSEQDVKEFQKVLEKHFVVVCTGVVPNDRPPYADGYRGYFTCYSEEAAP